MPRCTPTGLSHTAVAVERPARDQSPSPQLGKLRSFAADSTADLGERLRRGHSGLVSFTVVPRCSPSYLVR